MDHELLPLYGFKSITDYETIINVFILENKTDFLVSINRLLHALAETYPVKKFNLHKNEVVVKKEHPTMTNDDLLKFRFPWSIIVSII